MTGMGEAPPARPAGHWWCPGCRGGGRAGLGSRWGGGLRGETAPDGAPAACPRGGAGAPGGGGRRGGAGGDPRGHHGAGVGAAAGSRAGRGGGDNALGWGVQLGPGPAQLAAIKDLVTQAREPLRRALLSVAQQWAQHAAYKHRQIGDDAGDRARLAQALEWATEIGDRTMTATVLVNRGEVALLRGEAGTVSELAQAVPRDAAAAAVPPPHRA